jgi:hypothetical protein
METRGVDGLHAARFTVSRTRGPCQQRVVGNPGTLRSRRQICESGEGGGWERVWNAVFIPS